MLVYPHGYWYQGVEGEDAIDAILDGLENGGPAKEYLVDEDGGAMSQGLKPQAALGSINPFTGGATRWVPRGKRSYE